MPMTARVMTLSPQRAAERTSGQWSKGSGEPEWCELADCRRPGYDIGWWFPKFSQGSEIGARQALRAKLICASCPVRGECLDDAFSRDERHGVWGGLSTPERDALADGGTLVEPGPVTASLSYPAIRLFVQEQRPLNEVAKFLPRWLEWTGEEGDYSTVDLVDTLERLTYRVEEADR